MVSSDLVGTDDNQIDALLAAEAERLAAPPLLLPLVDSKYHNRGGFPTKTRLQLFVTSSCSTRNLD